MKLTPGLFATVFVLFCVDETICCLAATLKICGLGKTLTRGLTSTLVLGKAATVGFPGIALVLVWLVVTPGVDFEPEIFKNKLQYTSNEDNCSWD